MNNSVSRPKPPHASSLQRLVDPAQPAISVHKFILEWLESVGSDQDKRRWSESHIQSVSDCPISPRLTRSAPAMSHTHKTANSLTASMPPSTGTPSGADTRNGTTVAGSSSKRSLVEDPTYRDIILAENDIHYDHSYDPTPAHITNFVNQIRQDRDCPGPSADEIRQDARLEDLSRGASEARVENYFLLSVFSDPGPFDHVTRTAKQKMVKKHVPSTGSRHKVSIPVPDLLYGYTRQNAFPQQLAQLRTMGAEILAINEGLLYPFLLVEFKGESGNLWVATNQCLGGSATCVNITEELNDELRQCTSVTAEPINSAAFSIAIRNTEARLYVSWKQNERQYHMADVGSYLLHDPEQYVKFNKIVQNILDWGRGERLEGIRKSLDRLEEERESREKSLVVENPRTPESDTPARKRRRY